MKVLFPISIVDPVTGQGVKAAQYKGCRGFFENRSARRTKNLTTKTPRHQEVRKGHARIGSSLPELFFLVSWCLGGLP
jgi:hypothetical protein